MKTSDRFLISAGKTSRRLATIAFLMIATTTFVVAQEPYIFMEGSTHKFHVSPGDPVNNTLSWVMCTDPYNFVEMPLGSYSIDNPTYSDVAVTFTDLDRINNELVYLVVTEMAPNGCSTRRALQILIEPNNMYLEFASAGTQDCYNMGDFYAPLKVGLNFNFKQPSTDYTPIPESRFPLKVTYTIQDKTHGGAILPGNGGEALTLDFKSDNDYYLLVKDAPGSATETVEYELVITSVTDKYQAEVKQNNIGAPGEDIRLQIRIINHLPQGGNMNMAMAYYVVEQD